MIKVSKLIFFFSSRYFLKVIENMISVFLSSFRNSHESLGEAVEALACSSCSQRISRFSKLTLVYLQLDRNMVHVFLFLNWCTLPLLSLICAFIRCQRVCSNIYYKCFLGFLCHNWLHHMTKEKHFMLMTLCDPI